MKSNRREINKIDTAIIKLIAKRFEQVRSIHHHKEANNLDNYDPERERELKELHKLVAIEHGVAPELIEDVFKRVFEESRGPLK